MKFLTILLHLLVIGIGFKSLIVNAMMEDYLDEKIKQTKIEIAKLHLQESPAVPKKLYIVQWDCLWQESLDNRRLFIANTLNKILYVEESRVAMFATDSSPSNQTAMVELPYWRRSGAIKFIKSTVWKTMLYLLICYETDFCSLYAGAEGLQMKFRQSIHCKGHPMDASFFIRENRLYLVVVNNSGQFTVPSLIYHWRGTYMDKVAEAMTTAAVSVATFQHKHSTIMVFAQNDGHDSSTGTVVYEFKDTSADRIQFLPTINPVSVHHYKHAGVSFIFFMNKDGPSNLFWWDGQELLHWQQFPKIDSPSLVRIVTVNDDTFFVVASAGLLRLYKFENASDCTLLSSKKLPDGETVVNIETQTEKGKVIIVLIFVNNNGVPSVGSWEIDIKEISSEDSTEENQVLSKHLSDLVEMLQQRRQLVQKAESSWPLLYPANENLTISDPLMIPKLILESGTVRHINVFGSEDVLAPRDLKENLRKLTFEVDRTLAESKNLSSSFGNSITGDIVTNGSASMRKLEIDKLEVDFLNDVDIRSTDVESNANGRLPIPLSGSNIVVQNVEIESLCGIPFRYWALKNGSSGMDINLEPHEIEFLNDTVHLRSNVSVTKLNAKMINDLNIDEFLDKLFIVNQTQKIKGNLMYNNLLQIHNLTTEKLNNQSMESYMTTKTNQTFDHFDVKSLQIDHLITESINGVPVSEAARISRPNVIKGQVRVGKVHVTEEFVMDCDLNQPQRKQLQIYFNVTVRGDLIIKTIDMDKYTKLVLGGKEVSMNDLSDGLWTKTTDQEIRNDVIFENDVTIDQLVVDRLNGFTEEEFLYTSATVIPERFGHLRFDNVELDDLFPVKDENNTPFEDALDSLTIRDELQLGHLRGSKLLIDRFNGLLVSDILNNQQSVNVSKGMNFSVIRAKQVNVDQLHFRSINGQNSAEFLEHKENDQNEQTLSSLKSPEIHIENLIVERINGIDMKNLRSLRNVTDLKDLVIDGDLTVEGNLKIVIIDDQSPDFYLKNMVNEDIVLDLEETIDELIVQNATLKSMNSLNVNSFFEGVLSKSKEQILSGRFTFNKMTTSNVVTRFINDLDSSKLLWIDRPLFFAGNVTFDELLVDNVMTKTLNGQDVYEVYENLLNVPATMINILSVHGNVSWGIASPNADSLTYLFDNAVTKTTDQTIQGDVVFNEAVTMSVAELKRREVDEIRNILVDAVKDHEDVIQITGQKIFANSLKINRLSVIGDITIPVINEVDIIEFNNSVVRKDKNEMVTGTLTFLEEASINEVFVNDSVHDVPLHGLVWATDKLPPNVHFKHLFVMGDVYLKNLDGVDFDEFLQDRVTIYGDYDIAADVQFNGIVEVTGNTTLSKINGIDPSDLVLNGLKETQVISSTKTFAENLLISGNVRTSLINGLDVSAEYSSGVLNDENVEIIGDLVFESEVKVPEDVTVSERVNGMSLSTILEELKEDTEQTLDAFKNNVTVIENSIGWSSLISERLGNIFSYLESEKELKIQVPNVKAVNVVSYEEVVKLNMFGEEVGTFCGLSSNCSCPIEHVAELRKGHCSVWRTNGSTIVRNFHGPHSSFGINVETNAISSSVECTSSSNRDEFTKISWMRPRMMDTGDLLGQVNEAPDRIQGFITDVSVFRTSKNAAFVVLAVYYDKLHQTHKTDSFVYMIDFDSNSLSLHQKLPTDGALDVEVFSGVHHHSYLLLGCFGATEESFLYRLNGTTSQFDSLRTFRGRTRHVKSIIQEKDLFIFLDDYDTNAVNVYHYKSEYDNFYSYQSLFHDSRINAVTCFYADEPGRSDAFIIVTTENDQFYIYEYMFAQKFQRKVRYQMDGLQTMVPFYYAGNPYIFAGTSTNSTLLRIVKQGPH
ncbi:uncharacterized protein LOC144475494 [Augochlora pura]